MHNHPLIHSFGYWVLATCHQVLRHISIKNTDMIPIIKGKIDKQALAIAVKGIVRGEGAERTQRTLGRKEDYPRGTDISPMT